ncbi:hypothetical protein SAMN05444266_11375 [Chitinophaga jiangningensis]|uniref:Type II toxin-antitoxin system HicB family antitoxin n=1 Tax=Chitinophaga jiangningensis TaxID=1419482 RepID=A0A1M7MJE2_9BACT|nr:hypothetical protein [Chitinophaga jiangningensis]SHM90548.1 hypothetical protein SAMN05444266_11375 [Chitinophaga jiangningensis]
MITILFIVELTTTGYSAYAKDFDIYPVGTTAKSMEQLRTNLLHATNLYLQDHGEGAVKKPNI